MGIETNPNSSAPTSTDSLVKNESDFKEAVFLTYVNEQLLQTFEEALHEVPDVTDEEIQEWEDALTVLDNEKLNSFLAIPHEIMARRLRSLVERGRKEDVTQLVKKEADNWYSRGFRVAYHCSPHQNQPVEDGKGGSKWTIDGLEADHRDGDLGRAYYSTDLANLYRKKQPKYMYLVRADFGDGTTHKLEMDNTEGRASKLDVITQIDYAEAMRVIEERINKVRMEENNNGTGIHSSAV